MLHLSNIDEADQWLAQGREYFAKGNSRDALVCCRRALALRENFADAHRLMSEVLMPGDDYLSLLSRVHALVRPATYLEIGVAQGRTLALAGPETKSIGIDPSPAISKNVSSNAKVYPITSDEFFGTCDLFEEFEASRLAMSFVDGLHLFEQVLKDIINVERYADKDTVLIIHDCLPIARLTAARERATGFWCGDVWKTIRCLNTYRPDLNVSVIPTRPSGLGIITNLDPASTVLSERFDQILDRFVPLALEYEFLDLDEHKMERMIPNLVPNDWQEISKLLPLPTGNYLK